MHDGAMKLFQLAGPVAWSSGVLHALLCSRVDWLVLALAIAPLGKWCARCVGWWDPRSWAGENISGIPTDSLSRSPHVASASLLWPCPFLGNKKAPALWLVLGFGYASHTRLSEV